MISFWSEKAILKTTGAEGYPSLSKIINQMLSINERKVADIGNMEVFVVSPKYPGCEKNSH